MVLITIDRASGSCGGVKSVRGELGAGPGHVPSSRSELVGSDELSFQDSQGAVQGPLWVRPGQTDRQITSGPTTDYKGLQYTRLYKHE